MKLRGFHIQYDVHPILAFLHPLHPSLSAKLVLFFRKFGELIDPGPVCADVICGSPLIQCRKCTKWPAANLRPSKNENAEAI